MDQKGIISKFIIENSPILLSEHYDKRTIKRIKQQYFVDRYKRKFGVPTNKSIASTIINNFVKIGKIGSYEDLIKFAENHPYISSNIHDYTEFEPLFFKDQYTPTVEDIRKLKTQITYEREMERMKQEVIKGATEEIQEAIDKKREEYLTIPSIIDKNIFDEPELDDQETIVGEKIEWWDRLNLRSNPFQRQEGLYPIPTDMYEQVVLKTQIYETYLNRARNNVDELLYQSKLLIGDFGTGKTTLSEYLAFALTEYKIKIFRITLQPRGDVFTFNVMFENKLFFKIKEFYKERCGYDVSMDPSVNSCIEMLNILTGQEDWSFLIVIDDLHKIIGGEEIVMKFLASLQITKDEFIRNGVKVGFLVSGLPNWIEHLRSDGALRGFFDSAPDFMPEVTPQMAYEVIRLRFKAYSKNEDFNNFIDLDFIKQIHRKTVNESFLGFRTFMTNIEIELRDKGNYSIFESDPMDIDRLKLDDIRGILESDEVIKTAFNKFIYGSGIEVLENRDMGLKILIKTYLEKGIEEVDPFFNENGYYFQKLAHSNLINKIIIEDDQILWVVNPKLIEFNKLILSKHNLSMEDYLRPIYSYMFIRTKPEKKKEETDRFDDFIKENLSSLCPEDLELFRAAINTYRETVQIDITRVKENNIKEYFDRWVTSLAQLSSCIFHIDGLLPITNLTPKELIDNWLDYWTYPESIRLFRNESNRFSAERNQMPLLKRAYLDAFNTLYGILYDNYEINKKFSMSLDDLKEEEIEILFKCRKLFAEPYKKSSFFDLIKQLNEYLETKLRTFILIFMHLLYGDRKNRLERIKDQDIKEYIEKDPRTYDKTSYNEFENLNRGQYRKLLTECPNLKTAIFKNIFGNNYTNELKSFFEPFFEFNVITSHLKKDSINPEDQTKIYSYILNASEFIKKINIGYNNLLSEYFYIKSDTEGGLTIYFSYEGIKQIDENIIELGDKILKDISNLEPILLTNTEVNRVYNVIRNISGDQPYILDLEDYPLIERLFMMEYRKFLASLCYMHHNNGISIKPRYGSRIIIEIKNSSPTS